MRRTTTPPNEIFNPDEVILLVTSLGSCPSLLKKNPTGKEHCQRLSLEEKKSSRRNKDRPKAHLKRVSQNVHPLFALLVVAPNRALDSADKKAKAEDKERYLLQKGGYVE